MQSQQYGTVYVVFAYQMLSSNIYQNMHDGKAEDSVQ